MKHHLEKINAKVKHTFSFSADELLTIDPISDDGRRFHILVDGQSYRAELMEANFHKKTFTIKMNGSRYVIQLADAYDQMVERLGLKVASAQAVKDAKAPMPGLVLSISVEAGQEVKEGEPLLILEAMKMENVIKAVADGVVKAISVKQGAAVEKGQLLIEIE